MQKINISKFTEDYLDNLDKEIISLLNRSYKANMMDEKDLSFKPAFNLDIDYTYTYSYDNSLINYLFLKIREHIIAQLYSQLLYYYDIYKEDFKKTNEAIIPLVEIVLNKKKGDLSIENFLGDNDSFYKTLQKFHGELNKTVSNNLENHLNNISAEYNKFNPYSQFRSAISSKNNKSIILNNPFTLYKFSSNNYKTIPNHLTDYLTLLSYCAFRKGNLFSISNTALNYLFGKTAYPKYDKLELIKSNYNQDIFFINSLITSCNDSHTRYVLYYLLNHNFHNNFFHSLDDSFIRYILKRIDIIELYNQVKVANFTLEEEYKKNMMFHDFSISENMYNLRLLELLMKFDININDIDLEKDCLSHNIIPSYITLKDGTEKRLNLMQSNPFVHLRDMEYVYDKTFKFFYDFLNDVNDWSLDFHNEYLNTITNFIETSDENTQNENLKALLEICKILQNELKDMHNDDNFYYFKEIEIKDTYRSTNQFCIYMYLIKKSFSSF